MDASQLPHTSDELASSLLETPSNYAPNPLTVYSDLIDRCKLAASHSSILKSLYLKSATQTAHTTTNNNSNNRSQKHNHSSNSSTRTTASLIIATTTKPDATTGITNTTTTTTPSNNNILSNKNKKPKNFLNMGKHELTQARVSGVRFAKPDVPKTSLSFRTSLKEAVSKRSLPLPLPSQQENASTVSVTARPRTVGPLRRSLNADYVHYAASNLPPIVSPKAAPKGRRSGASESHVTARTRLGREKCTPRLNIHFYNDSSASDKNRNFVSFLSLQQHQQQREKSRLRSQISKMCSISFKKLEAASAHKPSDGSQFARGNLMSLGEFSSRFESLSLRDNNNNEGDDNNYNGDDNGSRKVSVLNNFMSNSILTNHTHTTNNAINSSIANTASVSYFSKDEAPPDESSEQDTQRTSLKRGESQLSEKCKSEFGDDEIHSDVENTENYYDM